MHILVVSQYFWPEQCPLNELVFELKNMGYEVTVFTGIPNYPKGEFYFGYGFFHPRTENHDGIKIIRVPICPRGKNNKLKLVINYLSFAFFSCVLAPFYCKGKYDIVFSYQTSPITASLPAVLLKRIKKIPMFLWVQDLWPESVIALGAISSPVLIKKLTVLVNFVYKNSNCILVQSKYFAEKIQYLMKNAADIRYLPNWADKNYRPIDAKEARNKVYDLPRGFIIMYAGNVGKAQSFGTIFKAMQLLYKYDNIHWVIIGDGSEFDWLKRQVSDAKLSGNVHLYGLKPSSMMPYYFSLADALLVSLENKPIFSLTIPSKTQAYLACGKPIIAALSGGGAEIIEESGAGFVVTPGDTEMLVSCIEKMYKMSPEVLRAMGLKGKEYYDRNFDRSMLVSNLSRWISEFTSK